MIRVEQVGKRYGHGAAAVDALREVSLHIPAGQFVSVMGPSGAHNPTLTVQALAWRTADYLVKNWKTIAT